MEGNKFNQGSIPGGVVMSNFKSKQWSSLGQILNASGE